MNIVVTGASRGIGWELVKFFSQDTNNKVVALARNQSKLQALKEECNNENIFVLQADLTADNIKDTLYNSIGDKLSSVDVLINNAGYLVNKPFIELTKEDYIRSYQVNVFGVIETIQSLLPLMGKEKTTHIINISSMGGFQGSAKFSGLSAYSSSKGALSCLSECLAEEFKESNIKVNCLALGAAQTEMLEEAFPGYEAPLSAKEMANFIAEFSLNAHKYLNGKIIPVALSTP
jgi:3-oxoacyl-[acyl-carrier protein] reductase